MKYWGWKTIFHTVQNNYSTLYLTATLHSIASLESCNLAKTIYYSLYSGMSQYPRYFGGWKKKKRGLYETRNLGLNWATMKEPVYFLCLTGYVLFILETRSWSQVWWHVSLISALERQISVNSRSGWSTNWEACYSPTNSRTAKAIIKRNLGKQNSTDKIK